MTVLNFPASPSDGDIYTVNGISYVYNNGAWSSNSSESNNSLYVNVDGDNMTGDLTLGTDKIVLDAGNGNINAEGVINTNDSVICKNYIVVERDNDLTAFQVNKTGTGPTFKVFGDGSCTADGNITLDGGITTGVGITFPDGSSQITAATSGGGGGDGEVGTLLEVCTKGNFTSTDINIGNSVVDPRILLKESDGTITAAGTVGVGTTTPDSYAKLAVRGHTGTSAGVNHPSAHFSDDENASLWIGHDVGEAQVVSNGNISIRYTNGSSSVEKVRIDNPTGNVTAVGSITAAGDIQSTSQNGNQLAGFRNQLINGNFTINQRFDDQQTVDDNDSLYWSDRWMVIPGGGTNITVGLNTTGGKSSQSLIPSSTGSGKFVYMVQAVELPILSLITPITTVGPFTNGSTWTVSGIAYSGLPSSIELTWSDSAFARGNTGTLQGQQVPISLGNNRFAATFTIDESNFLSNTHKCLTCRILFNNIDGQRTLTEVQLEPGSVATPYENIPIQTQLANCNRYYKTVPILWFNTSGFLFDNSGGIQAVWNFDIPMRTTPDLDWSAMENMTNIATTQTNANCIRISGNATETAATARLTDFSADAEL